MKELETSLEEAETIVASLETKIDTMEKLKEGEVPKAPEIKTGPIVIPEPEIRTIEVL